MTVDGAVRIMAGSFVTLSLALGAPASPLFVSSYFLWLTAFVGVNLVQSAVTGFCPAAIVFRKLGVGGCCAAPAPGVEPR